MNGGKFRREYHCKRTLLVGGSGISGGLAREGSHSPPSADPSVGSRGPSAHCTTLLRAFSITHGNGARPPGSAGLGPALFRSNSISTISLCPLLEAHEMGVRPLSSTASGLTPLRSNSVSTIFSRPLLEAHERGVRPFWSAASGLTSFRPNSISTIFSCLLLDAHERGVRPL